jgi:Trk-type K+ transport system membrane component
MQNPEEKGKRAQKKKNTHRETKKIIRNKVNSSNIKINKHKSKQTELIWSSGVVFFVFLVFCCSTCFRLPLFVMCFFALGFAVFLVFVVLI